MKCPDCNADMVPDFAYDPVVFKCPVCKIEVEGE